MGKRAWKCCVIGAIMATALWVAGPSGAEERTQPRAFNSKVPFKVYAMIGGEEQFVGEMPSGRPLAIPPCQRWYVEPKASVGMEAVRQEVEAQRIPGLRLRDATDADLEHLKGLTGLRYVLLWSMNVTDVGLANLKGLTALRELNLTGTKVADAYRPHVIEYPRPGWA